MPQKKLTKEQIDKLEAVTNELIERGHMKSLDPRDDDKSFKMKLKRDFDEKRKRVAEGLVAGHDEDHGKAEDLIIFGFEDEAAEKEFEKKVRQDGHFRRVPGNWWGSFPRRVALASVEALRTPDRASGLARRLELSRQRLNDYLRELEACTPEVGPLPATGPFPVGGVDHRAPR